MLGTIVLEHARRAAALAMVIAVAGCGGAVPPLPSQGGPEWRELVTDHFTVWTDGSEQRGRELLREMERFRQIIAGVAFPGSRTELRDFVVVLRDDDELAAFSPTGEPRPFAVTGSEPMVVLSAYSNLNPSDRAVVHELTHAISSSVIQHQPRWFAEGMAEFFETVDTDADSTTADVGVAPSYRGQPLQMGHLVPVAKLLAWRAVSPGERSEYSTAWALFTYLINGHRVEFRHYMQLLDEPSDDDSPGARATRQWNEAFPSLPLGAVDLELQQWLLSGNHRVLHLNIKLGDWKVVIRDVRELDVERLRSRLRSLATERDAPRSAATSNATKRDF
jgi:hypothetical protein